MEIIRYRKKKSGTNNGKARKTRREGEGERENNTPMTSVYCLNKSMGMVKSPVNAVVTFRFSVTTINNKTMIQT